MSTITKETLTKLHYQVKAIMYDLGFYLNRKETPELKYLSSAEIVEELDQILPDVGDVEEIKRSSAMYNPFKHEMYIITDRINTDQSDDVLIVHELVHATQDSGFLKFHSLFCGPIDTRFPLSRIDTTAEMEAYIVQSVFEKGSETYFNNLKNQFAILGYLGFFKEHWMKKIVPEIEKQMLLYHGKLV